VHPAHEPKEENLVKTALSAPKRLYLMQLSATAVPIGEGRAMEMVLPCYLVETGNARRILIDSGIAPDGRPKGGPPARDETTVLEQLTHLGIKPEEIDLVICTHFDVDHAGYHDAFPQAEFVVQREHYEAARNGHPRCAAARPHWDHPALRYRLVEGDTELAPGLTLIETSGHVTGHQSVLVRLPCNGAVLLAIDAVMMERQFTTERSAWPNDENEEQLRASTRKLLAIAEREAASLVVFGHDGMQWRTLKRAPDFYD
jgi:N-acyl homoserine lactone hydrolase